MSSRLASRVGKLEEQIQIRGKAGAREPYAPAGGGIIPAPGWAPEQGPHSTEILQRIDAELQPIVAGKRARRDPTPYGIIARLQDDGSFALAEVAGPNYLATLTDEELARTARYLDALEPEIDEGKRSNECPM